MKLEKNITVCRTENGCLRECPYFAKIGHQWNKCRLFDATLVRGVCCESCDSLFKKEILAEIVARTPLLPRRAFTGEGTRYDT